MYHKAWDALNGWQEEWESLEGAFTSDPVVASWSQDRLDIFGVGDDYAMYHKSWDGSSWSTGWTSLNGSFTSPPAVVSWEPGRLDLFVLGDSYNIYHRAYDSDWGDWQSGWDDLGGPYGSPPVAVSWAPDRLDIFAVDANGESVYHLAWDGSEWSAPESLGQLPNESSGGSNDQSSSSESFDSSTSAEDAASSADTTELPATITVTQRLSSTLRESESGTALAPAMTTRTTIMDDSSNDGVNTPLTPGAVTQTVTTDEPRTAVTAESTSQTTTSSSASSLTPTEESAGHITFDTAVRCMTFAMCVHAAIFVGLLQW